jgi:hypothetical protein
MSLTLREFWWRPDHPDDKVAGTLAYTATDTLDLTGHFADPIEIGVKPAVFHLRAKPG